MADRIAMRNKSLKFVLIIFFTLLSLVLAGIIYLKVTCQAIQIARLHNGITRFSLVSLQGNEHEPENCGGSLVIQALE